ncbi:MAG: hypothetical protein IBJ07_02830 [Rhizobiaceae bacterium]|nr:hypothetical protein [Rhizobiaceae bacterium]
MSGARAKSFGDLLDDLISSEQAERVEVGAAPTLQGDLLDQIERLQASNAPLFEPAARRAYSEPTLAPEVLEALDTLMPELSTDPREIALELGIGGLRTAAELDRARRRFAFENHPDRLAPHLRDRAAERMGIANGLIDTAKATMAEQ